MPQGRRKTPFSGKQKKQQIVAKRQAKKFFPRAGYNPESDSESGLDEAALGDGAIQKINFQSGANSSDKSNSNRYALQFYRETDKQLRKMREEAQKGLEYASGSALEIDHSFFDGYDFPTRPTWSYTMSKEQLERNENRYFTEYVLALEKEHANENKVLSYFELNLETWRQLWRVLEISDIILVIVDIRYPALMFPPSLFDYVTSQLGKSMILVLNKVDLAPPEIVLAWKEYFQTKYRNISVVLFTSYPGYNLRNVSGAAKGLKIRRRKGNLRMAIEGAQQVYKACQDIVQAAVDLSSWEKKIADEARALDEKFNMKATVEDDDDGVQIGGTHEDDSNFCFEEHVPYKNGILSVGCVGFPNVGKSSVMNALMGRKVVSVSKTPGHTKHFQTIFLTDNVRLCDCPGLVFPSHEPRPLQVLLGSFPIAQLRVPNVSVKYLAERIDLIDLLNIKHPSGPDAEWSAVDICEAWAVKRGFLTAKAARPDVSRAANSILRMALEGQISLCLLPPGFTERKDYWLHHKGLSEVQTIQAFGKMDKLLTVDADNVSDSSEGSDQEDDQESNDVPVVQNAFSLLNTD